MHSAQDAIAAIYSFLQQHGTFLAQAGSPGEQAVCSAAEAMIVSLQVNLPPSVPCTGSAFTHSYKTVTVVTNRAASACS